MKSFLIVLSNIFGSGVGFVGFILEKPQSSGSKHFFAYRRSLLQVGVRETPVTHREDLCQHMITSYIDQHLVQGCFLYWLFKSITGAINIVNIFNINIIVNTFNLSITRK